MGTKHTRLEEMMVVHPNAAGVDIGARELWACVPADRTGKTVRAFSTFTPDLTQLAVWLERGGYRGDRKYGDILDSGVRAVGNAQVQRLSGQCPANQACP